jgi:hypothetical protein
METTSDSANTVHIELISAGDDDEPAAPTRSPIDSPSAVAITSMNRPVPAAHRSFISNLRTFPPSSSATAFVSWPPMSRIVRHPGSSRTAPRLAALISLTVSHPRYEAASLLP